ncbi:lysophosphatidic acid receptor 6 [Polypterus senegalus]|uniref:lysophosphatidic acid receptor 6 n=1 Tax=Polypterus senegalus TaxID=55291 RepID=UPI0019662FAA|nr:lysophosphatidic acid receptor 6 [Polypterus senegalus]
MSNSPEGCGQITADFQFILFPVVFILVFVFGLTGNLVALYVFIFKITNHLSSNTYIINLAVVDTMFIFTLPFRIHYHLNKNNWIFENVTCKITGTLYHTNIYISSAFLTCICVDRYIAVVFPYTYIKLQKARYSIKVSMLVWAIAAGFMLSLLLYAPEINTHNNITNCFENFTSKQWSQQMAVYHICGLLFGFLIPFTIIMICYSLIARRISKIRTGSSRKALRIIYITLSILILCFLPYHITHLLYFLARVGHIKSCSCTDVLYKLRRITMATVSLNSCFDPLVYYFATAKFSWNIFKRLRPPRKKRVYTIYEADSCK